ncbi:hypothetical protein, partial [Crocosphaera watsonii]|uniref:hypothetical protein n=1 Tax=Crocosphaera watsonii TaxID=263511 RepID=UPI001E5954E4
MARKTASVVRVSGVAVKETEGPLPSGGSTTVGSPLKEIGWFNARFNSYSPKLFPEPLPTTFGS